MKFQNLSVKRLFGRVAMGLVLFMSGITIVLFFVTKQIAVLHSRALCDFGCVRPLFYGRTMVPIPA